MINLDIRIEVNVRSCIYQSLTQINITKEHNKKFIKKTDFIQYFHSD